MDFITYICCILPLLIALYVNRLSERQAIHLIQNKKETTYMLELAKNFIGKNCIIYFLGGSSINGIIKEISSTGNAILVENKQDIDIINLEFVTRIRKFPLDKKGKKKRIILD